MPASADDLTVDRGSALRWLRFRATIRLTAESVEDTDVHLVILLEGRQIARRITGDLIRIDLSHFITL